MLLIQDVPRLPHTPLSDEIEKTVLSSLNGEPLPEGSIGFHDAKFLDAKFLVSLIEISNARNIVEIGVAAGVSSAWILTTFAALKIKGSLYGFDLVDHFYANPEKRLGYIAYDTKAVEYGEYFTFGGKTSVDVSSQLSCLRGKIDLVFIDAQHCHPFPALDMLAVIDMVSPNGWIAHHDINLSLSIPGNGSRGHHLLFRSSRAYKLVDDGQIPQIGAIKRSQNILEDVNDIIECLRSPWEYSPSAKELRDYMSAYRFLPRDEYVRVFDAICSMTHHPKETWMSE